MTIYELELHLNDKEAAEIERLCTQEPMSRDECFGEDETIINTVIFPDGREMDIKCCGVQYEELEDDPAHEFVCNTAWTEAVLFPKGGGVEIACSDPSESYLGDWELDDYEGNTYRVNVIADSRIAQGKPQTMIVSIA